MHSRTRIVVVVFLSLSLLIGASSAMAAEPDYSAWNRILTKYYDPAHGMDYAGIAAHDAATLRALRQELAKVDVAALDHDEQLAYWINLYNTSVVGIVVDHYPIRSIRDLSTDLFVRLNVFKKPFVPFGDGAISLDTIENQKIREGFHDPRIHFAINCAARSCPPIRTEAYVGARVNEQLDDQARAFLNGPNGARIERSGDHVVLHVTKIMNWFADDFEKWGPGRGNFVARYLPPAERATLTGSRIELAFDDYDWSLNDWKR